ncbi:DUF6049 family protein [Streptomyces sp. NBC_01190]|uniref:DUF6049 family protein n=1 Tax=Streptomyces sp. NBC_01190 TaxID=2903767 RepID=UPI003869BAAD|nr:DUF6049 family protein [Streptomyces sp. NBC_01190]
MGEAAQAPGRAPSSPRRRLLRLSALVTGAVLLTGLLQATQATPSQARTPTGSRTATVTLNGLTPRVPTPDESVTVSGTVTNNSKVKITAAHIGVRIGNSGTPLASRSAMTDVTSRGLYNNALDGDELDGHTSQVADLGAGRTAAFSLKVPVSAFDLGPTGVYALAVTLDGQTSVENWSHVLGIGRTFLPFYAQGENVKSTQIDFLWPLTDRPHIAARGDTDSQQSPIFLDDDLAKELGPGGRLQQMVDLAKNLPVTWVVDPDLLASVEAMTKPYRVLGPGGDTTHTTPGTGTTAAKAWLNALRTAVSGAQVISLPFGDTDIASLAHQGRSVPGSVDHLKTAVSLGKITTDTILTVNSAANVAWPVDGALDPSIVSVARTGGAKRIIARSDTFADGQLDYTPSAPRPIGGGTTAVVADAQLSGAFTGNMLPPANAEAAIRSFVAQTLLITMQTPQQQRNLLVAPQRAPSISQARTMAKAISEIDKSPWGEMVSFDTIAASKPDPQAAHQVPQARAYPKSLSRQELPKEAFLQLQVTQNHLSEFEVILTRKDKVTVPFGNAVLRALSSGWRGNRVRAGDFRNAIGDYLKDLINAVHILDKTTLTLSGRSGTVPITVKNDLGQPITGLQLRLTSGTTIRLKIKSQLQPIDIDGGHTRTLKFQTSANANGRVALTAHLYTKDGALYGEPIQFEVKITKVTDLVMLIIGGGLLLLVLAGVRIYRQRKRQAADSVGEGGSEDDGGDDGDDGEADDPGPGHPGDPAADTAAHSPEASPADEKVDG